jgi:hypothetical protein
MGWFENISVRGKIVFSFAIALIMLEIVFGWAHWVGSTVDDKAVKVSSANDFGSNSDSAVSDGYFCHKRQRWS